MFGELRANGFCARFCTFKAATSSDVHQIGLVIIDVAAFISIGILGQLNKFLDDLTWRKICFLP